jgi:hypothetical protein
MGAHSTLRMTHQEARAIALNYVLMMSGSQLERLLDDLLNASLYSVRLIGDDDREEWERDVVRGLMG